ncbi:hypothetical protein, partial [Shigella sonnei]|uniref:hypothetical protein n=1 Tax=Shigella sonnei TaxID=624 RepID=UPI0020966281
HQASFVTGNWCYDRHCSVRLVICFDLAIDQIAQSGLSSLKVIYYSAQLFSAVLVLPNHDWRGRAELRPQTRRMQERAAAGW